MLRSLRLSSARMVVLLIALLLASGALLAWGPLRPDPAQDFAALRTRVEATGSYRVSLAIEQTLLPRATPAMIGQQEQHITLSGEGVVALPDRSTLTLRRLDQPGAPPISMLNAQGRSFVQQGDRLVAPAEQPAALAAPSLGLLAYLDAASDVAVEATSGSGAASLRHYRFRIEGARLIALLADQQGLAVPQGALLADRLQGIGGTGELWVDADGLPVRQLLELNLPVPGGSYDAQARIDASFADFGRVTQLIEPRQEPDGVWRAVPFDVPPGSTTPFIARDLLPSPELLRGATHLLFVLLAALGLLLLWLVLRRARYAYLLVTLPICALLVVQPALLPGDVGGIRAQAVAAAEQVKTEQLAAQAVQQAQEQLQRQGGLAIEGGAVTPTACGSGSQTLDSDDDGLNDFAENCLGTDFDEADSDGDAIGDGDEVTGFSYAGQTWTSDPLKGDTNGDGVADTVEWPFPYGLAVLTDTNTNNIPDLWDLDNDGDGVEDSLDLAPQQVTSYRSNLALRLSSTRFLEGATYIDVQLQPQNPAELRYGLATLDWPLDSKGQVTDLDNSPNDIRLVPMLEITTTVAPALAARYGAVPQRAINGEVERLLVPLSPVEQYGKVSAFSARVAYLGDEARDLTWDARLVWVVQAQVDSYVNCRAQESDGPQAAPVVSAENCALETNTNLIQTYAGGSFRLTGLDVSRSRAVDTAIFGAPRSPFEGETMLNLLGGLSETYLSAERVENQAANRRILPELAARFNNPGTPPADKFTITDTVVVAQRSFGHSDEATSSLSGADVPSFLDANAYAAAPEALQCPQDDGSRLPCAMLALAIEQDNASAGLPASDGPLVAAASFNYQLDGDAFVFSTLRSLKLGLYTRSAGAWQALTLPDALASVNRRYDFAALAREAQSELPGVTAATLRTLTFAFFLNWLNGTLQTSRVDGEAQLYRSAPTNVAPLPPILSAGLYKLPILVGTLARASQVVEGVTLNLIRELKGKTFQVADDGGKSLTLIDSIKQKPFTFLGLASTAGLRLLIGASALLSLSVGIANVVCPQVKGCDSAAVRVATININLALNSLTIASTSVTFFPLLVKDLAKAKVPSTYSTGIGGYASSSRATSAATPAQKAAKPAGGRLFKLLKSTDLSTFKFRVSGVGSTLPKILKGLSKVGKALGPLGLVVELGLVWGFFGSSSTGMPGFALKAALANAIISSVFAIAMFALSFVPGGNVISAIIGLIDSIVQAATGGQWSISRAITEFFYTVKLASELRDIQFVGRNQSGLGNPALGLVAGNRFLYSDIFSTTFTISDSRAISATGAFGSFSPIAPPTTTTSVSGSLPQCVAAEDERTLGCTNSAQVAFDLAQPQRNLELGIQWRLDYSYAYLECVFFGRGCISTKSESAALDKADQKLPLTIDVLPATLSGFVNWREISNPDPDGDGLNTRDEQAYGINPNNWDSDNDGLSDGYELGRASSLTAGQTDARLDPRQADSDNDGLSDGDELRRGTNPVRADSDDDGLNDGAEVIHLANGALVGGWTVVLPGTPPIRVAADPQQPDGDGDGLNDLAERANRFSPAAANDGPLVGLDITPQLRTPDGLFSSFARPGGEVRLDLALISGGLPVTSSLELCLPAQLRDLRANALTRVSTLGAQADAAIETAMLPGCASGYRWSLNDAQQLQLGELVSTTLTARLDPALNSSQALSITASTLYSGRLISATGNLVVDADLPSVEWSTPENGAILRGQQLIVGGTASDATSGLARVEVRLPGSAAFSSTTDLSPWAASWALPADGVYTLEARAVDGVGQVSPVATRQVTVDNTAPTVATSLAENAFVPISGATDAITLTGSANDNLSGVARVQLSIDGRPWQELTLPAANQTASNWSYVWPVDRSAQGTHRLALRAYDRAGNLSSVLTRTIIVDTVAPANELTTRSYEAATPPVVQANTPLTLTGYVNDAGNVPLPLRPRSDLLGGVASVATATVWLEFPRAADSLNSSATWLGDVNGDGLGDLAVGSPNAENGAGRITVVYGRGGDWRAAPLANALADSLTSFVGRPDARLGTQIAPAGDLNGDGLYDMLVGDAANNRVFVVWGRVGPLGRNTQLDGEYATGWATISAPAGTRIGTWQSAAGDINGDGFDDVLIGATPTAEGAGQLFLVAGQGAGRWPTTLALPDAATAIYPFPAAGSTARGVGDVNGDGLDDWALLDSPTSQSLFLGDALLRRGLGDGPLTRALERRVASFALPSGTGRADLAALGDVNGDALDDFVYRGAGGVPRLVLGRTSGGWADSFVFDGYTPALGGFVAAPGDLNADGLNDLLLGGGEGEQRNAYLFYGARSLPTRPDLAATFSGVAGAASAPYAAGSDLNCDASSDLLLVPLQTTSDGRLPVGLSYGALPQVDLDALPQARANNRSAGAQAAAVAARLTPPSLPPGAPPVGTWLYVDDDYCPQCANDGFVWNTTAFSSLQSALNAASSNTQIVVRPGVYGPAQVQATATLTSNMWITGVNPDAVFVDGDGAGDGLVINGTAGGGVLNLTIRNTQRAVVLRGVGASGDTNPALVPIFDRLLLLAFREAGLAMDRASTADVRRTTFAGSASATSLFVDPTPVGPPPALNWTQAPALPAPAVASSNLATMRGQLYAQLGDDWRYYRAPALPNGLVTQLPAIPWLRNSPTSPGPLFALTGISRTNELVALNGRLPFETVVTRPQTDTANGNLPGIVYATARDSRGNMYIGGDFRSVGGVAANYVAVWSSQSGQWLPLGSGFDAPVYALAVGAGDRVYAGGAFTRSGDGLTALNKVAVLNGTLWQALAGGFERGGPVYALAVDTDGTLLAGGAFDSPLYYDPPGNTGGDPATSGPTCDAGPDQIALYELPNFNQLNPYAWCQVLGVGEYINLAAMDAIPAGIASIRLGGLLRATLYTQENLQGPSATFPSGGASSSLPAGVLSLRVEYNPNSTHRLARWNPTTQAWTGVGGGVVGTVRALEPQFLVNGRLIGEPGVYVGGEIPAYDPPASDTCDANQDQVALYDLVDFNRADPITPGDSACQVLPIGDYANLALDGSASSLRVGGRVEVQLYNGPNFTGGTLVLGGDDRDLATNGVVATARSARVRLKPALHNVRRWTGTTWAPLGPGGINGPVYAIKNLGTQVFIGGSFSDPGSNIITWRSDLQRWEALLSRGLNPGPAGVNGPVYTIGRPRFDLLVGGAFTQAGSGAAPSIAIWNFSSWGGVDFGARNGTVRSMSTVADQPELFVGGETLPGSRPSNVGIYDSAGTDWRPLTRMIALNGISGLFSGNFYRALPGTVGPGLALAPSVENPNDPNETVTTLYALSGGGQTSAYRLQISDPGFAAGFWQPIAPLPTGVITGSSLAWANGTLYALLGGTGQLYRYTPQSNSWLTMTTLALPSGQTVGAGARLASDGGDSLYATQGGGTRGLFRYSINENRWRPLADLPVAIGAGGGLVFAGGRLFITVGGGSTASYSSDPLPIIPSGATQPTRLLLRQSAFVAPASLAAPNWSNIGPSQLLGFGIRDAGDNVWLGGSTATWVPTVPTTATLAVDAAGFLDAARGLYRVRAASPLRAGYSLPAPDAVVAPDFGPTAANDGLVWGQTAFNSIQAAIDAGALRITLRPGRYQEPFSLASGIELVGAGADSTLLTLPFGSTAGAVIDAGGVQGARLSNVSIVGNGTGGPDGLRAAGAQLRLARSIVRDAAVGVRLRGATTRVELVNLTLANNRVGVEAQAAPLDLRNSLLAFHTTAALSYTTGPTLRYPFNAFWQNAANYRVNGAAQEVPQAGVVVVDPRLSSPEAGDFRPLAGSSLLGSGSPADPTPPGTGGRVDIGYLQQGRAALYVDDDYCDPRTAAAGATCDNDGLEWGVDAFNRIQPALDAARVAIQRLDCSEEASSAGACSTLAVGVAPGSYSETLTLSSRIALVGSGADRTSLTGAGAAPVVTIDNAFQVALRGLSIVGGSGVLVGGAARDISLERLIMRGGSAGVQVNGGAGVQVAFTTFAAIGGPAVLVEGARSQAEVASSILTGGPSGLRARTGGRISSGYNLLNTTLNYDDGAALPLAQRGVVERSDDDLLGSDPRFVNAAANDYRLLLASPAVDSADPFVAALAGGGERTDRGYAEVEAIPLAILPGKEGVSCQIGNSGAAAVEVAAVLVPDATQPTTATLPSANVWQSAFASTARPTAAYWSGTFTPPGDGLYRLYGRARDAAGNSTGPNFLGSVAADGTPPTVEWRVQPPANLNGSAVAVSAQVSDYLNVGGVWQFNVDQIAFEVVVGAQVQTYSADWDDTGWDVGARTPRRFQAIIPLPQGASQLRAVARDQAGNRASTALVTVQATNTNSASFVEPTSGAATAVLSATISGSANFASGPGAPLVVVTRSGNNQPTATFTPTLATPGQTSSAWNGVVTLPADGVYTLTAQAARGATLGPAADITLTRDSVLPTLAITPIPGIIGRAVTLTGTAGDALSGLAAVEISADGGTTWDAATIDGATWRYSWSPPVGLDGQAVAVQARARDRAGNIAVAGSTVAVDTLAPTLPDDLSFGLPERSYLDLDLNETLRVDGLTPAVGTSLRLLVDSVPTTTMTATSGQLVTGPSINVAFPRSGRFYLHLAAVDAAGNVTPLDVGPYFAGTAADLQIQLDGQIDRERGEWLATMRLDDDERPQPLRTAQELYWAADDAGVYLGWQGAQWALDGSLVAYLGTGGGGTSTPLADTTSPTLTLPFAARYAVVVSAAGGTLYEANGSNWTPSARPWRWVHDPNNGGGTEIALPFLRRGAGEVRLLALTVDEGKAWSLFPTTNLLHGPWTTSHQLTAQAVAQTAPIGRGDGLLSLVAAPLAQRGGVNPQPRARNLLLTADAAPPLVAASATITYLLTITSNEANDSITPVLQLTGTGGLRYTALAGLTCGGGCPAGGATWAVPVPNIAPGATRVLTVTGQAPATTALTSVTSTLTLNAEGRIASNGAAAAQIVTVVDGAAPEVSITSSTTPTIAAGQQILAGLADDGFGAGVERVELRLPGSNVWQVVSGTNNWVFETVVPSSATTYAVAARATDRFGATSTLTTTTFTVDAISPTTQVQLPSVVSGTTALITGTAQDPFPLRGDIALVEVQIGAEDALWQLASALITTTNGVDWRYAWPLPSVDSVPERMRVRATDAAGNLGLPTPWQTTTIDTVAPLITGTEVFSSVTLSNNLTDTLPVLLRGEATDGGPLSLTAELLDPTGALIVVPVERTGTAWEVRPRRGVAIPAGSYRLLVQASDVAGNLAVLPPIDITIKGGIGAAPTVFYLPLVVTPPPLPDLVVEQIKATNAGLEVVIRNQGDGPATAPFWVELYLNPTVQPTRVNQIWPDLGAQGAVWGVTRSALPLEAKQRLTLRLNDAYFRADLSDLPTSLTTGAQIFVQVDSASTLTSYGAVLETHELANSPYNNIRSLVVQGTVPLPISTNTARSNQGGEQPPARPNDGR